MTANQATRSRRSSSSTRSQLDPIYVDIAQSSDQLVALRASLAKGAVLPARATITLTLPDGTAYLRAGTVEFAEVTVDENSGTVTLSARTPNPQDVLPGMFVRVAMRQGIVPDGIVVPQQAISRDPRGNATALGPGNKVVQRKVATRQAIGASWLVTGRLEGWRPADRRRPPERARGRRRHARRDRRRRPRRRLGNAQPLLHRAPDLRLGNGDRHHAGRDRGDHVAADRAISRRRAARRQRVRHLPRRQREHPAIVGDAGAGRAAHRHRPPARLPVDVERVGPGRDRRHLREGDRSRHRAGAGTE